MKVQTLLLTLMLLLSGCLGMADEDVEKIDENDMFPDDDAAYFDTDGDGLPDQLDGESTSTPPLVADMDDDNDGFLDSMETTCGTDPLNATSFPDDLDGDFECDEYDFDVDGDTVFNDADAFPRDASASTDTDGDGMPDTLTGESTLTEDLDDDNDGWSDLDETACGTNSLVASLMPVDENGDGVCDAVSTDDDGDSYSDDEETQCESDPLDATSIPADLDNDTICDALDDDMDGDGTANAQDMYPRDPSKHEDVPGCTDTASFNFDADANLDDGTCLDAEGVFGMMMNFMENETWHTLDTSSGDMDGDGVDDLDMVMLVVVDPAQDAILVNQVFTDADGEEMANITYLYTNGTVQLNQYVVLEEDEDTGEQYITDEQVLIHHQYMVNPLMDQPEWMHCEQLADNSWVCSDSDYFIEGNPDSATETLHLYTCADGTTVMSSEINDGNEDCADGSDEPQYTETYSYTCLSGETIGLMHVNNGEDDCADGSDETKIFQCADGSYVYFLYANDGGADCNDESDEPMYDVTELSTFDCMDGSQIYLSQVNDGIEDCMDADDEPTYEETEQTYFDCDDGISYIYLSQVNDGTQDCADGEDEATFDENGDETSTFECEYTGDIIPLSYVNDGGEDCPFGEDEPYTGEEETSTFDCADGSDTIDLSEVNNDYQDCEDASDEPVYDATETSMFDCEDGSQIYFSLANDGAEDCANGEDEPSDVYVEYSTFDCADGETIELSLVNDGAEDCRDGDDEPSYDPITQQELTSYQCPYSGESIALSLVNDGSYDCGDYEDEPYGDFEPTRFTCDDGDEIYMSWLNDDYNDCQGGEDEAQYDMGEEISVFTCDDGTEVAFSMVNNGDDDCDDGEDESYTYECVDGSDTIPLRYVNVGYYFCQDYSDESDAQESSEFTCFDGETIPLSYHLDDEADCTDASDEIDWDADYTDCVYDDAGFWVCAEAMPEGTWSSEMQEDGSMIVMLAETEGSVFTAIISSDMSIESINIQDIEDGEIESASYVAGTGDHDLTMDMTLEGAAPPFAVGFFGEAIQSGTFECNDGTIIEFALLNDGAYDCADEEDEPDYEEEEMSYWMCADEMEEIPLSMVSDGYADCEDGSDEVLTSDFDCNDGTTITLDMVSDDNMDCADGEDEPEYEEGQDTNVFYCDDGSDSVPMEWVNDDYEDCQDGSDEGLGEGHGYGEYNVDAIGMMAEDLIEWNGGSLTDATSADVMDLVLSMCDSFNTIGDELSVPEDCGDDLERWSFVDIVAGNVAGVEFVDADNSGTLTDGDMFMISEDLETTEDWNAVRLAKGMAYADENPEVVLPGFTAALGIISMLGAALLVRKNE